MKRSNLSIILVGIGAVGLYFQYVGLNNDDNEPISAGGGSSGGFTSFLTPDTVGSAGIENFETKKTVIRNSSSGGSSSNRYIEAPNTISSNETIGFATLKPSSSTIQALDRIAPNRQVIGRTFSEVINSTTKKSRNRDDEDKFMNAKPKSLGVFS